MIHVIPIPLFWTSLGCRTILLLLLLFSVTGPYAMPKLWGGGVPTSDSGQFSPRLWVPSLYSLSPTRRSKPGFMDFNDKGRMNGYIGNDNRERSERRTDTGGTNSQWMGRSYLPCDRRDCVLFRTARRNYYPAVWEFATAREPKHYNLPLQKFLRLSKPQSWTGDPEHMKYRSILLGQLAHAGIRTILYIWKLLMCPNTSIFDPWSL